MRIILGLLVLPLFAQQISQEKERGLGNQIAAEIRRHSLPVDIPEPDIYLRNVGSQLAAHLPDASFAWNFETLRTGQIEPMPLPGGLVLVPEGFFLAARNEAEFAAMLAHAMGHIALRHGTRSMPATAGQNRVPLVFPGAGSSLHSDS